jgi:uncharacterized membrane protein YfcA
MLHQIDTLVPGLTLWTVLAAVFVCFAASTFGGMSGFGAGLIVTLFLTPIVGAKAVIPMLSVTMLMTNASRVWFLRSSLDLRMALTIAAIAAPMSIAGANVFVRLDSAVIQAMLGIVLIVSVPARRLVAAREMKPGTAGMLAIGGTYGFLSSIIVGAGMLIIPLLMGSGLAGVALLATDAMIATLVSTAKIAAFGTLDALALPMLAVAVVMGLAMIPGTWLSAWIVRRTQVRLHTAFIETVIVVGALGLIYRSVM